ncbi:hypothetical protein LAZ67_19001834 [Cordylochernes scorpioides]|uniref:Mariner transposase n=1 Tax=Cordylochernes scorpioides TaxID=51811 RepID=A0ABY6LKV6_9ARAC|nr:hypothetical protein LAZ67_19001834 [Cordylochernes scorpioides]
MFSEGRVNVNDEERAGRPSTSTTDEKINEVEKMILANHRITVREVSEDLNISMGSCHSIFINDLGMRRVAAKFVPKLLNCDQKQHRMNIANEMLDSFRDAQICSRGDVVHHEFLPQGRMVNKEYYLQVMRNFREAIRQKRPDLWKNKNWLLHHDNATAHTSLIYCLVISRLPLSLRDSCHRGVAGHMGCGCLVVQAACYSSKLAVRIGPWLLETHASPASTLSHTGFCLTHPQHLQEVTAPRAYVPPMAPIRGTRLPATGSRAEHQVRTERLHEILKGYLITDKSTGCLITDNSTGLPQRRGKEPVQIEARKSKNGETNPPFQLNDQAIFRPATQPKIPQNKPVRGSPPPALQRNHLPGNMPPSPNISHKLLQALHGASSTSAGRQRKTKSPD